MAAVPHARVSMPARPAYADSVLEALLVHARYQPDACALRSERHKVSYSALLDHVLDLAERLEQANVEVIALALDNGPAWVLADLAAQVARVTVVPLPPFFTPSQVRHVLASSRAEAIVSDAAARSLQGLDTAAAQPLGMGLSLALLDRSKDPAPHRPLPSGTSKISYTSGTTGQPKGVCLAQPMLDRVAHSICLATAGIPLRRHLAVLPLATLLENVAGLYAPLLQGGEVVLPKLATLGFDGAAHFDVDAFLTSLDTYLPDSLILLPQLLAVLVQAIEQGACVPESLRFIAVGGGCVPRSLLERADRLGLPVYEGYGLTECGSVVALNTPAARRLGSVGRPLAHVRIAIAADAEIRVAGSAMLGTIGEPAPAAPHEIPTGDLGHLDGQGYLYIDGRRKNIFITSYGRNVAPEWIEAELVQQPHIAQAVVFGEGRPWNAAVIVPRGIIGSRPRSDAERTTAGTTPARRAADAELDAAIAADIARANAQLPAYARIARWIVARRPFSPADGLTTANGRNRRDALWQAYSGALEPLWTEA
jgi:long-chain acyl-CoA synthetase